MDKNFFKNFFNKDNKKVRMDIFTIFIIGITLIFLGNTFFLNDNNNTQNPISNNDETTLKYSGDIQNREKQLERRLESVFSKVEGAGEVMVMVTASSSSQKILAEEISEENSESNNNGSITKSSKKENKIVMAENSKGNNEPYVIKEGLPEIEGVVIVAQGGDDIIVQNSLISATEALLNVPAHKIYVLKMK